MEGGASVGNLASHLANRDETVEENKKKLAELFGAADLKCVTSFIWI